MFKIGHHGNFGYVESWKCQISERKFNVSCRLKEHKLKQLRRVLRAEQLGAPSAAM